MYCALNRHKQLIVLIIYIIIFVQAVSGSSMKGNGMDCESDDEWFMSKRFFDPEDFWRQRLQQKIQEAIYNRLKKQSNNIISSDNNWNCMKGSATRGTRRFQNPMDSNEEQDNTSQILCNSEKDDALKRIDDERKNEETVTENGMVSNVPSSIGKDMNKNLKVNADNLQKTEWDIAAEACKLFKRVAKEINSKRNKIRIGGLYDEYKKRLAAVLKVEHRTMKHINAITSDSEYPLEDADENHRSEAINNIKTDFVQDNVKAQSSTVISNTQGSYGAKPATQVQNKPVSHKVVSKKRKHKKRRKYKHKQRFKQHRSKVKAETNDVESLVPTNQGGSVQRKAEYNSTHPYYVPNSKVKQNVWSQVPMMSIPDNTKAVATESPKKIELVYASNKILGFNKKNNSESTVKTIGKADINNYIIGAPSNLEPYSGFNKSYMQNALKAFEHVPFFSLYDEYEKQMKNLNELLQAKQRWWNEVRSKGLINPQIYKQQLTEPSALVSRIDFLKQYYGDMQARQEDLLNTPELVCAHGNTFAHTTCLAKQPQQQQHGTQLQQQHVPQLQQKQNRPQLQQQQLIPKGLTKKATAGGANFPQVLTNALELSLTPQVGQMGGGLLEKLAAKMNMTPIELAQKLTSITNSNDQHFTQMIRNYLAKSVTSNENIDTNKNAQIKSSDANTAKRMDSAFNGNGQTVPVQSLSVQTVPVQGSSSVQILPGKTNNRSDQIDLTPILDKILRKLESIQERKMNNIQNNVAKMPEEDFHIEEHESSCMPTQTDG